VKIRYDVASSPWPKLPLGQVVQFKDAQRRPVKETERKPGPFPYYGANGEVGTIDGYIFDENLVLLAEDGGHFLDPARPIAYEIGGKTWVNNHAHVLAPGTALDASFLAWHLSQYDVSQFLSGSTRPKLTKSDAERIPVIVPPLPEQRRIVDILNHANSIRRLRREAQEKARQVISALFVEMFGAQALENGFPVRPLSDVADIVSGVTKGRRFNGEQPIEVPYLRVANVQADRLDLSEIKTISALRSDVQRLRLLRGDVLLTEGGDYDKLGRGALLEVDLPDCIHQNHVFRVRVHRKHLHERFFAAYLQTAEAKSYFLRCTRTRKT
jgi:type I restriction enzyme S subunit